MIQLGRFQRTETGYAGVLKTLSIDVDLRIEPAAQTSEKSPDHRVFEGDRECGAGWTPDDETGGVLNLRIEDPALPGPLRARLVRGREADEYLLVWRRSPGD